MVSPPAQAQDFPLLWEPVQQPTLPILVTIPHYGVNALPGFSPADYATPEFVHFAHGFADPFAAAIYGQMHKQGATVLASPYSRLFVDLNRARDDFTHEGKYVESRKGVIRTHTLSGRALFRDALSASEVEDRLRAFYDPYHTVLQAQIDRLTTRGRSIVLLDAHAALSKRFGDREIIVSTQRGKTARPGLDRTIGDTFAQAGFKVEYDVSGYAGGHTVRSYGRTENDRVDAIQIEVGLATLLDIPRMSFIDAIKNGQRPQPCASRLGQIQECLDQVVHLLADELARSNSA